MNKEISSLENQIIIWFIEELIPFWVKHGIDYENGGFVEEFDINGPIKKAKRTRVTCRQIYVYSLFYELTKEKKLLKIIDHGASFLFENLKLEDNLFVYSKNLATNKVNQNCYLYEQSFALYAISYIFKYSKTMKYQAHELGDKLINIIQSKWGFSNSEIHKAGHNKINSDPYMHLFEALQIWYEITLSIRDEEYLNNLRNHIEAIINQTLINFISNGLIAEEFEFFDKKKNLKNKIFVPGHQFEWGWLFMKWGNLTNSKKYESIGITLIQKIENLLKIKSSNFAFNSFDMKLQVIDSNLKIWPQCERLKAWSYICREKMYKKDIYLNYYLKSLKSFYKFSNHPIKGWWNESFNFRGNGENNILKSSSLYHIAGSVESILNNQRVTLSKSN